MAIPPEQKKLRINGYEEDDPVLIINNVGESVQRTRYLIRRLGTAGFFVRGLATCFYWHEKMQTWDDVPSEQEPKEPE